MPKSAIKKIDWKTLNKCIAGDLLTDHVTLQNYSLDQSIFSILPMAVAYPKNNEDLQSIVAFCQKQTIPIIARGAGSGVAGQSIGHGLVIDFKKFMHHHDELAEDNTIQVQPGVILNDLNKYLKPHQRKFAPDPGSYMYCTLGGMFATNAAGPLGLKYGACRDHVESFDMIMPELSIVNSKSNHPIFLHAIKCAQDAKTYIDQYSSLNLKKNSSGYHFQALLDEPPSIEKFFSGSEGTLGLVTRLQLKTVSLCKYKQLEIFRFDSIEQAAEAVATIVSQQHPHALELLDAWILQALITRYDFFKTLIHSDQDVLLCAQWESTEPIVFKNKPIYKSVYASTSTTMIESFWSMRSQASPILHELNQQKKPLRCIEDTVVPIDKLASYIKDLKLILKNFDCDGPIFGHIGQGHVHVNPWIDPQQKHIDNYLNELMQEVYALVYAYQGSFSGEHGDGLLRARYVQQYQAELMPLYRDIKHIFDPYAIYNPGKVFGIERLHEKNLRNLNLPWNNVKT